MAVQTHSPNIRSVAARSVTLAGLLTISLSSASALAQTTQASASALAQKVQEEPFFWSATENPLVPVLATDGQFLCPSAAYHWPSSIPPWSGMAGMRKTAAAPTRFTTAQW